MCDTLSKNRINTILDNYDKQNPTKDSADEEQDLTLESERLKTFENQNPQIQPQLFAKAGLYYSKSSKKIKCAYCNIHTSISSFTEDPLDDHLLLSPGCPYARGKKGQSSLRTLLRDLPEDRDVCGNLDTDCVKLLKQLVHPYEDFNARLSSFKNWPKDLKQKPEDLAAAGFYYKGVADKTVCFYCCGPLNNWEEDDDPWEQHALWFPKCKFLRNVKGEDFIDSVREKLKASVPDCFNGEEPSVGVGEVQRDFYRNDSSDEDGLCIICCNRQREVILMPCGHDWTCFECMKALEDKKCPICREQIICISHF